MKRIFSITMLIIGLLASRVFAESISDLYLEALPEAKKASQKTGANPFSSTTTSLADLHLEDLVLMGTAVGEGDDQYALINGHLVRIGDRVAGYRVSEIHSASVMMKRVDEVHTLSMEGGF